jgi:uncharacterized phiE125 gp8 family phage protein
MGNPILVLKTPPAAEVLTLAEIKKWSRISSYSPSEDITPRSTIAPGSHAIGSIAGTVIDISGYNAYFIVDSRTNGAGGTVALTIKESNDNVTFNTWAGGGFAKITESNDNQFFKLDYTGTKRYLRIDAVVAGAACEFGVNIILDSPVCGEDDVITFNRQTVREIAEKHQGRAYLPQTWQLIMDRWPCKDYIDLMISPVRSITSITYKLSDGTISTWDSGEYYLSKVYQKETAKVYLGYGESFPSDSLYPYQAITVEFEAGFADLATYNQYMNSATKQWMLCACDFLYRNRDKQLTPENFSYRALDTDAIRVPFA